MNIYEAAAAFRDQAVAHDQDAARYMVARYERVRARLEAERLAVVAKLEAARREGRPISPAWPYQDQRARRLLEQADRQLADWANAAQLELGRSLGVTASDAFTESRGLLDLNTPEGAARGTMVLREDAVLQAAAAAHTSTPLGQLFAQVTATATGRMRDALVTGIARGRNPRVIGRELAAAADIPLWRGRLIARTETMRTWRTVSLEAYRQANVTDQGTARELVKGWRWWSALDRRTCPSCWAQHGSVHPLDELMATHPNCRCVAIPVTATWAQLGVQGMAREVEPPDGPAVFRRLPAADQRAILGPGLWKAYRAKRVTLPDMVLRTESEAWGPSTRAAGLKRSLEAAKLRKARSTPTPKPRHTTPEPPRPQPVDDPWGPGRAASVAEHLDMTDVRTPLARESFGTAARLLDALGVKPKATWPRIRATDENRDGSLGAYWLGSRSMGIRHRINLSPVGSDRRKALQQPGVAVHEYGHALDRLMGLDRGVPDDKLRDLTTGSYVKKHADALTPEVGDWARAVAGSRRTQQLLRRMRELTPGDSGHTYLKYLAGPAESWARSFHQWLAYRVRQDPVRFRDDAAAQALLADMEGLIRDGVMMNGQWRWDDFHDVARAVERVLRAEGVLE